MPDFDLKQMDAVAFLNALRPGSDVVTCLCAKIYGKRDKEPR